MDKFEIEGSLADDCRSVNFLHASMMARVLRKWKGKELQITIEVIRRKRSDRQNRYMWSVIVPTVRAFLQETTGDKYTNDQVYTWLRVELLQEAPQVVTVAGKEVIMMIGKRFSSMTTKEFAEAVDKIRAEMLLKGCDIPEPRRENLLTDFAVEDE